MAFAGTIELMKSRSMYKEEFILEESRPRDLSLRSSSSEDSQRSKQSHSSRSSSGDPPIKENSGKIAKPASNATQRSNIKQSLRNDVAKKSDTRQSIPQKGGPQVSKPSSVGSKKLTLRSKQKSVMSESRGAVYLGNLNNDTAVKNVPVVPNSAGISKSSSAQSRITVHSRHFSEDLVKDDIQCSNSENKSGPMQVVSSQLLSNVKEEIRKRSELLSDGMEETPIVSKGQSGESELEKDESKKLAKSESNVHKLKTVEKEANLPRPATQASAKAVKRIGPIPANKPVAANNKAFVSMNQNPKSTNPSYLQPTRSSSSRAGNDAGAKDIKTNYTKPTTDGKSTGKPDILKVGPESKHQEKSEAETKSTTNNLSCTDVNKTAQTVSGSHSTANNSGNVSVNKVFTSNTNAKLVDPKSGKPMSTTSSQLKATSSKQSITNSAKTQNSQKSSAGRPLRGNSSATIIAKAPAASVRSESNISGKASSQVKEKDDNTQESRQVNSNEARKNKMMSASETNLGEVKENIPSNFNRAQSDSGFSKVEMEKADELPAFQYKPASAGKPPLVEIVTSVTPRRVKPEPVVEGPMQTPVIEDPFADLYPDNSIKPQEKKPSGKGMSATAYGYMLSKPVIERSKTNISIKSRGKSAKKKDPKPSSANLKLGKRRGGAKSKERRNTEDAVARPKSGKRIKSGKRRKKIPVDSLLGKQASQSDIALISGIGWHVAASCIDKSDVIAVKCTDSQSSVSSESEHEDMEGDDFQPCVNRLESLVFDNLEMIRSGNFNIDVDTPRFEKDHLKPKNLRNTLNVDVYQQIDSSPNTPSPRFKQIKPDFEAKMNLPRVDNDGYRPMNLDLTQTSLSNKNGRNGENNSLNSLPPNFNNLFKMEQFSAAQQELDEILYSNPAVDEANEELNRQILIDKLTPIPESPSLSTTTPIHKTLTALRDFDEKVKDETLNDLLGLNGQTPRIPKDVEYSPGQLKYGKSDLENQELQHRNSSTSGKSKTSERTNSSSQKSSAGSNSRTPGSSAGKKNLQLSAGSRVRGPESVVRKTQSSAGSKTSRTLATTSANRNKNLSKSLNENSRGEIEISIENLKSAIQQNKLKDERKKQRGKQKEMDLLNVPLPAENIPLLDLNGVDHAEEDDLGGRMSQRKKKESGGRSTRRERKFSETKSEEQEETNLDEVVEEILSNTLSSTRSNRTLTNVSRNSTLTDADRDLLLKMTQNESPFYAKLSASVSDHQRNNQMEEIEDITAQQPQLQVTDDLQRRQKQKFDTEAIAKIMNSFKHMELYAGKGGSLRGLKGSREHLHKPHMSVGEPSSALVNHKPPITVPKGKSAGKFTEIRGSKQDGGSMRNSSQKEASYQFVNLPAQDGTGFGDQDSMDFDNKV